MTGLATVRRILAVNPILNADLIEVATIDGWNVVVKKGEFKPNDLCVYFQIDSFLPVKPQFAFLKDVKKMGDAEGYRLRTIKLRGQVSQGLALPLNDFGINPLNAAEGDDVTDTIGVLKYEKPLPANLRGQAKGYMPSFLRKTDEERVQNISPFELAAWLDEPFIRTLKRDGSSMTVYCNKVMRDMQVDENTVELRPVWEYGVCSRNMELKENSDNAFWAAAITLNLSYVMNTLCRERNQPLALQGELYGDGIQGNPHKIQGTRFEVFNIWDIEKQEYLEPLAVKNFLGYIQYSTGIVIPYVPSTDVAPLRLFGDTHAKLIAAADAEYKAEDGGFNEGHVYKSARKIDGKVVSFKVISNQYLLKVEE